MKTNYLIAALITLAPAFVQAEQTLPVSAAPAARTSVKTVLVPAPSAQPTPQAGRDVRICGNEAECDVAPHRDFAVTRAQVLAELYRARAAGEIPETEADNDVGRAALRHHAK